ncbi:MAG TPA: TA system VapC family ribonuclease toxin [Candidatus Limnocylindrales bacterium]|nr:TA system VapC family ribonuclease toxin [Candidatus Limnocylindrales bacterium]
MSTTVDTSVLVYASNQSDRWHEGARRVIERLASGPELVYLFWPVLMGYLRVVTHPSILPRPLAARDAMRNIAALIERPNVQVVGEADGFWTTFLSTAPPHSRGNDVPDAHLVALMRQNGVRRIYTRDQGFRRFAGIEVLDLETSAR